MNVAAIVHVDGDRFDELVATAQAALDVLADENVAHVNDRLVAADVLIAVAEMLTFDDVPFAFEPEEVSS